MRRLIVFFVLATLVSPAAEAACKVLPLGETSNAYRTALSVHLSAFGAGAIVASITKQDETTSLIGRGPLSFMFKEEDGLLTLVGFALVGPSTPVDVERLSDLAAFALSRFSADPISKLSNRFRDEITAHPDGAWADRFGPLLAVVTKSAKSTVVKIGRKTCD